MGLKIIGASSGVEAEVDSLHKAMRVALRPVDYGALGYYSFSGITGIMAAGLAANSEIFQLRYTGANVLLVKLVRISAGGIVAFAAGVTAFDLVVARAWSADGSGGTALTLTGNNGKLKSSMTQAASAAMTARVASTAALTAGTKTLDSQGVANVVGSTGVTAGTPLIAPGDLFNPDGDNEYPVALVAQEGVVVRATVPATGTWTGGVIVKCVEVPAANWPG